MLAGRILRPVHRLTAAARAASEQDLSQRLALQRPPRRTARTRRHLRRHARSARTRIQQPTAVHRQRQPRTANPTDCHAYRDRRRPRQTTSHPYDLISMAPRSAKPSTRRAPHRRSAGPRPQRAGPRPHRLARPRHHRRRHLDGRRTNGSHHHDPRRGPAYRRRGTPRTARHQSCSTTPSATTSPRPHLDHHHTDQRASLLRVVNTGRVVPADQIDRLSCLSADFTNAPATTVSVSASPSPPRSPPSTTEPSTQSPSHRRPRPHHPPPPPRTHETHRQQRTVALTCRRSGADHPRIRDHHLVRDCPSNGVSGLTRSSGARREGLASDDGDTGWRDEEEG